MFKDGLLQAQLDSECGVVGFTITTSFISFIPRSLLRASKGDGC